jgi:uncharacterized protein YdiU (UPF0061 family)
VSRGLSLANDCRESEDTSVPIAFFNSYLQLPGGVFARESPTAVAAPKLLALNLELAQQLGLEPTALASAEGLAMLAGNRVPAGATPIALAYAGHQFGHFVPQLGDGRALLLGEVVAPDGRRWDVQLKGSGRTPFSRGGDGRAGLGPVLREYLVSDAMHALGVATTRSLAAVATGEMLVRETLIPGAVLTRVAASHLRVGTFEYFSARNELQTLEALTEYALTRHYPEVPRPEGAALALFDAVLAAQARLVARWMALGFVHGVMNTDNTSISGETIDYGPCAFLDTYAPDRSFSSIDRGGRYSYRNQPRIAQWNLARLAEALLPLVNGGGQEAAQLLTDRLKGFIPCFETAHRGELGRKLGLRDAGLADRPLLDGLLERMAEDRVDFTLCFRRLVTALREGRDDAVVELFAKPHGIQSWLGDWHARLAEEPGPPQEQAERARLANPAFIPRNHQVEAALAAAAEGELGPFERLHQVLRQPYDDQPEATELAEPPGDEQWSYRTSRVAASVP